HRLDLVGDSRRSVVDEARLEGVDQLLAGNDFDDMAGNTGAFALVDLEAVHVVETAAALQLRVQLQAGVVLPGVLPFGERVPERARSGADVDDVDELRASAHVSRTPPPTRRRCRNRSRPS